ncbi:MAG TPA: cytochrome P450 [Ornithinibacter sp.]|nr:cytochrome P450 [Ornithinibacter sp.]
MASAGAVTAPLPPKVVGLGLGERLDALRNFHTGAAVLRDHGGPVVRVPIGPRRVTPQFVLVTSPTGAHDVLAGFDGALDKGVPVHEETKHVGLNLFNLPHEAWKPRRRAIQPLFTKKHVRDFAVHMSYEAQRAAERAVATGRVDLDPLTRRLTLQVLGRSVLGQDLGPRAEAMAGDFATLLEYFTDRGVAPVRVPARWPTPGNRRFARARERFFAVIDEAVDQCRRDPGHPAELIRLLLDARDPETGRPLTAEDIRGELSAFLIAGHDTTATTLCYSLWALGRDPSLQDRVAAEVAALGRRPLDADDVPSLELTTRVVHEALRLCPPAAVVARVAMRDVVVDGWRVPAGSNVVVGIMAMHTDPALWPDPQRFDPDRFLPEASRGRDRWQYLPFGAGPRSCIGDHFAMLEATLGLATLVRAVRVESLEPEFPLAVPFTMTAGGPIPAVVTARS